MLNRNKSCNFAKKYSMSINITETIQLSIQEFFSSQHQHTLPAEKITIQKTKSEFEGDFTIVCFSFTPITKKSPDITANELGLYLVDRCAEITNYNVIKGFLNITIAPTYWNNFNIETAGNFSFGIASSPNKERVVIEFSSPNTNKPLHLGHIRNNLLGHAVSEIVKAAGYDVIKVNLINDRGIHICKSMLAWMRWGNEETPQTSGLKGDHLIGKYYVMFDQKYKEQISQLVSEGMTKEIAEKQAPLLLEAQEMLVKWENNDPETRFIWKKLNQWVYEGFDETYKRMGISFDKVYYESNTYTSGKIIVQEGLDKEAFYRKEDQSVWVDLTDQGLDEKLLLRGDGTSVYMTQDLGTALLRHQDFEPQKMVYVVGNEQNYHFDVLKLILNKKMGYEWAEGIFHLSYGMVELPSGKMKSREGTVVDADDLMDAMIIEAKNQTTEKGKIDQFSNEEANELFQMIGLGALKYFILKVDPKKNMLFNPEQSIELTGNTAPFIQYTHARICSLIEKSGINVDSTALSDSIDCTTPLEKAELEIIKHLHEFPQLIQEAAVNYSPALVANYIFELVKLYNSFYQDTPILKEMDIQKRNSRLLLSLNIQKTIQNAMKLLGIDVPRKM